MKRLNCKITITGNFIYIFDYVNNITIESGWDMFTQKCLVELPNKFQTKNETITGSGINNLFKRGDKIKAEIGNFPNLENRFEGYITDIEPGSPFKLHCQDAMWQLKRKNIASKSWSSVTINELINYVLSGTGITAEYDRENIPLGAWQINNTGIVNIANVLDELKKKYGIICFISEGKLQVRFNMLLLGRDNANIIKFSFNENILPGHSLNYRRDDDTYIYIQGENIGRDNSRTIRYAIWENNKIVIKTTKPTIGEQKVMKFYNVAITEMEETLKRKLPNYVYTGYEGEFVTLGEPAVEHGDIANIYDVKFPERAGKYVIKKVVTTFGINGYRQQIYPYSLTA